MLKDEIDAKLREKTRRLVKKWGDLRLVTDPKDFPILKESHSTLIMQDGTRINYMTEDEKQQKLKEYYERVTKHETQVAD